MQNRYPRYHAPDEISKEKNSMEPVAVDLTIHARPPTLQEMFAMYLQWKRIEDDEPETPEEADDFEPDWDEDTLDLSPYEIHLMDRDDNPPGADPDAPTSPDPEQGTPPRGETDDVAKDDSSSPTGKESSAS